MSQIPLFPPAPGHRLLVIDGNNVVYRTFHAPTSYSPTARFEAQMKRLCKSDGLSHALIVWDPDDDSGCWRRELWSGYKAGRRERPHGLSELFDEAKVICDAIGLAQAQGVDDEADDIIASYTEIAVAEGLDVTIVSSDKDLLQLIRDEPTRVRMLDGKKTWGPAEVTEKFGVEPGQMVDYLALVGDSTDGFPGVPSIGPKRAQELLSQHVTLERLLAEAEWLKSKATSARLRTHRSLAMTCYRLASLRSDISLPIPLSSISITP